MDLKDLRRLVRLVEGSEINELEIEDGESRVRIVKSFAGSQPVSHTIVSQPQAQSTEVSQSQPAAPANEVKSVEDDNLIVVTSPMVGTFYRSPSPGAEAFVKVGDRVSKGQTLCILEAMKLMNELECEVEGTIREILVENAQPIEYGQKLFLIEP